MRGAAEEQVLGQSFILLYPVHGDWTIRSQLCQLSSFQAWRKGKLLLLELEHFWALYLKSLPFNVQGKHNRKSVFLLPWSVHLFPRFVEAAWPDAETPLHVSETSLLIVPVASSLNQSLASLWWGKGTYFLLKGITSLEWYVLCVWMKNEKTPLWTFPPATHITSLSHCPLAIIISPVKEL